MSGKRASKIANRKHLPITTAHHIIGIDMAHKNAMFLSPYLRRQEARKRKQLLEQELKEKMK